MNTFDPLMAFKAAEEESKELEDRCKDKDWFNNHIEQVSLEYVDSSENSYKYYMLTKKVDSFLAEWGRIGAKPQNKLYTTSATTTMWNTLMNKLKKGYIIKGYVLIGGRTLTLSDFLLSLGEHELLD